MVDMKRTASEKKESSLDVMSEEEYPWGLQISLGKEEMEKLGIDLKKVGDECTIVAVAKVTSISQSSHDQGEDHKSMSLQITEMETDFSEKKDAASKLYGDK